MRGHPSNKSRIHIPKEWHYKRATTVDQIDVRSRILDVIYCNRNCLSVSGVLCVLHCVGVC